MPRGAKVWSVLLWGGLVAGLAGEARASGFELPGRGAMGVARGGAFTVRADNPTAVALNPGALTRRTGTHLFFSNNVYHNDTTFTRAESSIPTTEPTPEQFGADPLAPAKNRQSLFPLGPVLAAVTDFGLENWRFGLSVFGPRAVGQKDYPVNGGNRYLLTGLDVQLAYVGATVSYGEPDRYGVGVTFQYVTAPKVEMQLALDGITAGNSLNPYYSLNDVEGTIDLHDSASATATVGAWWRALPQLEVAAAGRVIPVYLDMSGDVSLSNVPRPPDQDDFGPEQLEVENSAAQLDMVIPPTAKLGLRYRHLREGRELFDLELDVVYEAWSMLDEYDLNLDGQINLVAGQEAPDVNIQKNWRDTLSVRLGGTWQAIPDRLGVSLGTFWERGATPKGYEHLDFPSFQRFGLGGGLRGRLGPFRMSVAYSHVFQEDRTVDEAFGKVYQIRPLAQCDAPAGERDSACNGGRGVPSNAGTFESSYDVLSVSVEASF